MDAEKGTTPTDSVHSQDTVPANDATFSQDIEGQGGITGDVSGAAKAKEMDPNIVDWDGLDDPENPLNWPSRKKSAAIALVSFITMLSTIASTIISPATEYVMEEFNSTNEQLAAFVTSVYLLGYVFGPLVLAPMSELRGRAVVYNIGNTLFLIFNIACAVAPNLGALIVFRLLAGIAGSAAITIGAGSIADMMAVEKRGLAMVSWIMGPLVGPTVAPLIGSYLAQAAGWRWVFWLVSILAGAVWLATLFLIRESYPVIILQRKMKRLQKETGNANLRSALDTNKSPKELFKVSIVRPIKLLFLSPIVFMISLYMALVYGYLYLMFTTFPRVFQGQFGFSDGSVGLAYLGSGIGSFLGLIFCGAISDRLVVSLTKRNGGEPMPEYRLPAMFAGAILLPIALFLYAWTAQYKVHWILPIIGSAILGAGMFTIFMPGQTYLVDAYTQYAASVSASATIFRSLLGALLPLAGNGMYDALGLGWGTSLLGFIAVAFMPVPLIFWFFGERIRTGKMAQLHL